MAKQTTFKETTESRLAFGFNDVVGRELREVGEEDVGTIANACGMLLTSYLAQLAPIKRTVPLSAMVDKVFAVLNDAHDADLEDGGRPVRPRREPLLVRPRLN